MPDSKLVEDVCVRRRQVGDRVVAKQQALEHRLVDDAAGELVISADRREARLLDRRLDYLKVDPVKVDHLAGGVCLLAERHQDEAERLLCDAHGFAVSRISMLDVNCPHWPCSVRKTDSTFST